MRKNIKNILVVIGGTIFTILFFGAAWLAIMGMTELVMLSFDYLPRAIAIAFIILFFLMVVFATAFSRIYSGGGSMDMIFRNLRKNDKEDEEKDGRD